MVASAERLRGTSERPFWVGEDLALRRGIIVPARGYQIAEVLLNLHELPDNPSNLDISIRSRYVQLGLDVEYSEDPITPALMYDEDVVIARLRVNNYAPISAVLLEETPFCRFYRVGERNIEGEDLDARLNDDITIAGEKGSWEKLRDETGKPIGIRFYIDPATRRRILPIGRPIVLNFNGNYREEIDKYAKPIEPNPNESFWFGQTYAQIELKNGTIGIIQDVPGAYHLHSRLIEGGTNWPIRVEMVSATLSTQIPQHVDMVFQKAA